MEGPGSGCGDALMAAEHLSSGKGHRDENFPVASILLRPAHRGPVMAFYRFARAADDIADHESAAPPEKLRLLALMRAGLGGDPQGASEGLALHQSLGEHGLDPVHASELLGAFVRDVTVNRYADWDELIGYCRLSAMPVGRFMLDVHGESRACWPASDALCAALQVINHLQDCGKDYRALDRVYIPAETLAETGAQVADLGAERSTPALRAAIIALVSKTRRLLAQSTDFAAMIVDRRLAAEVAIIQRLALSLCDRLEKRDPLSEFVHHHKHEAAFLAAGAAVGSLFGRAA